MSRLVICKLSVIGNWRVRLAISRLVICELSAIEKKDHVGFGAISGSANCNCLVSVGSQWLSARQWPNYLCHRFTIGMCWATSRLLICNHCVCCGPPVSKLSLARTHDERLPTYIKCMHLYAQTTAHSIQPGWQTWYMLDSMAQLGKPIYIHTGYPGERMYFLLLLCAVPKWHVLSSGDNDDQARGCTSDCKQQELK